VWLIERKLVMFEAYLFESMFSAVKALVRDSLRGVLPQSADPMGAS
jgi:hypothetical protein